MKNTIANISKVDAGYIFAKFLKGELVDGEGPVDLNLLHQQKMTLIDVVAEEREAINEEPSLRASRKARIKSMEGLLCFLDAFQDMLVDDMKVWEYPKEDEDETK